MKRLLNDTTIKNLKPQHKGYKKADGGGLYLFVTKSGVKSFRYDFQLNGKWLTQTLGQYPSLKLADARALHEQSREQVAKGIDPRAVASGSAGLQTFSYYAIETMKTLELKPATENRRLYRMQKYLFPALDRFKVDEITSIHLLDLIKPISDRGTRETAQLLITYCRQTFDTLRLMQVITVNPAEGLGRLLPKPKEGENFRHVTNVDDLRTLLRAIDGYTGDYATRQALRLMPLVFLRPYNVRFLRWDYIDLEAELITIPASEMKMNKPHKVPLAKQAIEILKEMEPLSGGREFVFYAGNRDKPMSENTLNQAIRRAKDPATGQPLGNGYTTSHGFRHTASTFLNELKYDADAIELQLAHQDADRVRRTYNKAELLPERVAMMQGWADYLDSLKRGADVIPIAKKQA
jgi:integrase